MTSLAEEIYEDIQGGVTNGTIHLDPSIKKLDSCWNDSDGQLTEWNREGERRRLNVHKENSRPLRSLASIFQQALNKQSRVLELGHGAGTARAQFLRSGMSVDSVGKSPVSPHIIPHDTLQESIERKMAIYRNEIGVDIFNPGYNVGQSQKEGFWFDQLDSTHPKYRQTVTDINHHIDQLNREYFGVFNLPKANCHQYIGNLATLSTLPREAYDLVHDDYGALHYSMEERYHNTNGLSIVLGALRKTGILIMQHCEKLRVVKDALRITHTEWRGVYDATNSVLEDVPHSAPLILFHESHERMRNLTNGDQLTKCDHLADRLKELLPPIPAIKSVECTSHL